MILFLVVLLGNSFFKDYCSKLMRFLSQLLPGIDFYELLTLYTSVPLYNIIRSLQILQGTLQPLRPILVKIWF